MPGHEETRTSERSPGPWARPFRPERTQTGGPPSGLPSDLADRIPWAVDPLVVPDDAELDHHTLYFNRELSWLDFNWRVLHQAMDARTPVLERARFLAITESNLDEFFRKRVGGLKRQREAGVTQLSPDGRTPVEQLQLVWSAVLKMREVMSWVWSEVRTALDRDLGVVIRRYEDLDAQERETLHRRFRDSIYPILTPLAVDPGHPFPFISNLSLSLAVVLRHPTRNSRHFARVKIPTSRTRFLPLSRPNHFLPVEELVVRHVDELFRGMTVESAHLFRVTRNADLRRDEEEADDLLEMISEELRERRSAPVVRLEVETAMPDRVRALLCQELKLHLDEDVVAVEGLLDLADLFQIADLGIPQGSVERWEPVTPPAFLHEGESEDAPDVFAVIRRGDVLVHHPYESFTSSVQRFIESAADDPDVLAIKLTLYRTSDDSPVVGALIRAAEAGKQVAVLVEVTARFDEQSNIEWGQMLERHGVHVTYGLVGLKTHAKVALVLREEEDGIRAYCHVGTGNYHPKTARLYSDLGLLTCRPEIGSDLINLFHYLTGHAPEQEYDNVLVAPWDMRRVFVRKVQREIEHQERDGSGRMILKMNALDDVGMIQALYRASRAGVEVDLVVRGHTRLRPGLPRFSENVRLVSIIGRFLEHDRVFWFHNDGDPEVFIGSADWRRRNLDDRVEAVLRVDDPDSKERLRQILVLALSDNRLAWELGADGRYALRRPEEGGDVRDLHQILMRRAVERRDSADTPWEMEPRAENPFG